MYQISTFKLLNIVRKDDDKLAKDKILTCYSCGNKGVMKYIGGFNNSDYAEEYDEYGEVIYHQLIEDTEWTLFECPICHNPVLFSEYTCAGMPDGYSDTKIEFPDLNIHNKGVPEKIRTSFLAAARTRGIDRAICLLSLRRTLEMICKDKNAEGKNLENKISDLVQKKILPEMMNDACWVLRQLGNDAAHADDIVFTESEVRECIEFVSIIINYLYSMPTRVEELRNRIEKRKRPQGELEISEIDI